ncbi:MAG: DUF1796 family putative cysteine peptidase [Flavobacteriales bacterium]|jgi:hypothetical protein|tara:strand:- start:247 stop:1080 length:834 start_codon:yes stop_codon:yes gene_type:complete
MRFIRKTIRVINKFRRKSLLVSDQNLIVDAASISNKISVWLGSQIHEKISFGEYCITSSYLKKTNNKTNTYPYDWIFSSPEIVLHSIKNDFDSFLDKDQIYQLDKKRAGHSLYHSRMFNHKSPLKSEMNYDYYVRAVNRLKDVLKNQTNCVFVITVINESENKLNWTNGFDKKIKQPINQSLETFKPLVSYIKEVNPNSKFLFISQYTHKHQLSLKTTSVNNFNKNPYINLSYMNESIAWIDFMSIGSISGTKYRNKIDDMVARIVYQGLNNKAETT